MSTDTHAHSNPHPELPDYHHEDSNAVGSRNRLGVVWLLVADVTFTLSVLFVFFYLKGQNVNNMWLPKATSTQDATVPVSSIGAWYVTAIAAIGFLTHRYALLGVRMKNQTQLVLGSGIALGASILGLIYQGIQIDSAPFTITMGAYASCYYLIAGLSFMHFFLTTFISLGNWNRSRLGLYKEDYWHVDIVNVWWIWMTVSSLLGAVALSFA